MSELREALKGNAFAYYGWGDTARMCLDVDDALATFREWLEENGLVVVPREATREMRLAGFDARYEQGEEPADWNSGTVYAAMIAAAPNHLEDTK